MYPRRNMRISLYLFLGCLALSSCGASRVIVSIPKEYCAPTISYTYDSAYLPVASPDSLVRQIPAPANFLTPHDVLTANAIGALPVVRQWVHAFGDTSVLGRLRCLELKTKIHDRVLSVETEINSIAAELDCEGERADQLGAYLDNINKKRTNLLTAASIIAAAGTTIATVLVQGDGAKNGVAIGGGLLSAGLTAFTISPRGKRLRLVHERNLLTDIWYAPVSSSVYPPAVWYILREKAFSNGGQVSLLESIHRRWITFEPDAAKETLLFKDGGVYTADDLHTRANMLNQVQATVRSINQDLQGLLQDLSASPAAH